MKKDVVFTRTDEVLTAAIQCDLDHHAAKGVREKIDDMLFCIRPQSLVLDFTAVEFMDSSGLGLILGRVEKAGTINARVLITGLTPRLLKLIRLSGIERIQGLSLIGNRE